MDLQMLLLLLTMDNCDIAQVHSKSLVCIGREDGTRTRPVIWKTLPGRHPHDPTFEDVFDHFSNTVGFNQQFTIFDRELEHATS